jgi:cytoskeletal protein CcmA (bactofilin family)
MGKVVEPVLNVNEVSRVPSGTIIRGDIYSPNDIRIDGSFEGRIISKCKVVVGENAVITGDIVCENADFWGKMHGNFYVKDTLSLKSSSVIEGDLKCRRLEIEMDARFDGNCQTINEEEFNTLAESMEMV